MMPLVTLEDLTAQALQLGALATLAGVVTLVGAAAYRWYVREALPQGVGLLLGASAIALVLNTTASLGESIGGTPELLDAQSAAFTVLAFIVGGIASEAGRHVGIGLAARLDPGGTLGGLDWEVSSFVRGGGRTRRIHLPEEIHDIDGYDPVRADIKADLAGETLTLPGRLSPGEIHEAIATRLIGELGIGKVDIELTDDGEVAYLAIGRGEAGLGHTLQPGQVAVAIEADPAFAASPGDQVTIWATDPEPRRVLDGEVRGIVEDIVTVAIDADAAEALADERGYRLTTRPHVPAAGREFATLVRRANESIAEVTIAADSPLIGQVPAALDVTVLLVETDAGQHAPPPRDRALAAGERIVAIGRPDALRQVSAMAQGTSP